MAYIFIGSSATILVLILFAALTIGAVLKKHRWDRYLPASVASIILGFLVGVMMNYGSLATAQAFHFSPAIFFFLLLPPIMFDAGFSVRRKMFFKNFGTILVFAFVGTFISCVFFALIMWIFSASHSIPLRDDSPLEGLVYGGLISATDPVAVLALLNGDEVNVPPTLYSIVFGESMLNDAIAIVLYNTFRALMPEEGKETAAFTFVTFLQSLGNFILISVGSTAMGFVVALASAFVTRHINLTHYHGYEVTVVVLFAWISYFLCEAIHLSGIMSIFFTGIGMAHYTYYNISKDAQIATKEVFHSLAHMAETFVFCYIGITVGLSIRAVPLDWDPAMAFAAVFATFASRALFVFPLSWVVNFFRKEKIPVAMQIPIWWAGLRGAVAVALSLDFPGTNGGFVVTSTLVVVLITTIVCGGTTVQVLNATGMNQPREGGGGAGASHAADGAAASLFSGMEMADRESSGHGHGDDDDEHDENRSLRETLNGDFHSRHISKFRRFDRTFMRKWFGGNPKSSLLAEDHQESGPSSFVPPTLRSNGEDQSHSSISSYVAPSSSYTAPTNSQYPSVNADVSSLSVVSSSSSSAPFVPFVPSYLSSARTNGTAAAPAQNGHAVDLMSSPVPSSGPSNFFSSPEAASSPVNASASAFGLFDEAPVQPQSSSSSSFDFMS